MLALILQVVVTVYAALIHGLDQSSHTRLPGAGLATVNPT